MLAKANRITKEKEFALINKLGRSFYSPVLMVKIKPNDLNISRFATIVSNKVSKKATQRNLIRRRLSEIIRLNLNKIKSGFDILVIVSPKIISQGKVLDHNKMKDFLGDTLHKARLV